MLHLYLKFQKARKCNGIFGKEKTKGGIWYHLKLWPTKKQHIFALGLIWGTFTCLPSRYLSSRLMSTLILNSNQQSDRRESHFSYLSIHFCSIASIPEWIGASYFTPGWSDWEQIRGGTSVHNAKSNAPQKMTTRADGGNTVKLRRLTTICSVILVEKTKRERDKQK